MVEIRKGDEKMEVARSAFENFYKNAGWISSARSLPNSSVENEADEWDDALLEDQGEKPLSQMNNTELIEKAISLGLNVGSNPTNKQLRSMIKNAIA